ncbi:MAG: esterase family protein [Opitutaceae bacterium]|nr:esterase family protein [Opitutaceae bacterium]
MTPSFRSAAFAFWLILSGQTGLIAAKGTITSHSTASVALGHPIDYLVYRPPDYVADGSVRYPVLYLLHGRGDKMEAWATVGSDLDGLIGAGRIPPVIAVMPDAPSSLRAGYYVNSLFRGHKGLPAGEAVEQAIVKDLVPHIDATLPTRADRSGRCIAGYSMGGYGALRYALAHPECFGSAIILSPAVYVPLPPMDSSTREFGAFGKDAEPFIAEIYIAKNYPALLPAFSASGLPLTVFIGTGDDEQASADPGSAIHDIDYEAHTLYARLRRIPGVSAQLRVVDGGHNWRTWRPLFSEGLEFVLRRSKPPSASH